jgi:hypothetical protein
MEKGHCAAQQAQAGLISPIPNAEKSLLLPNFHYSGLISCIFVILLFSGSKMPMSMRLRAYYAV